MIDAASGERATEQMPRCGACGVANTGSGKFCAECGQALEPRAGSAALPIGAAVPVPLHVHRRPRRAPMLVAGIVTVSLGLATAGMWRHSIGTSAIGTAGLAISNREWSSAIAAGARAQSALPLVFDARAETILSTARRESEALVRLTEARGALEVEEWDVVPTALDAIKEDSVYAGEASQLRSRAEQASREEQDAQKAVNDGRLAMRLGKWDDAIRILSTVPATRTKAIESAHDLRERTLLAKQTEGVASAYRQFSAATTRLGQIRDRLRFAGGFDERLTTMSLALDAANELLNASRLFENALSPSNGSSLPPARLLADGGTPLIESVSTLTGIVASAALAGTLTESQFTDLNPALLKVHEWAVPLFAGEEESNLSPAARMLNSDQPVTPTLPGFAGNPNEQAQVLLGWLTGTSAESVAEGEEVFRFFVNDTVAEGTR